MPELVNSRVGSLPGTSGADGTIVWPLPLKNSRKSLRMRAVVYGVVGVIWLRLADGSGRDGAWRARKDGKSTRKGYQSVAPGRQERDKAGAQRPRQPGDQSSGSQRVAARIASPSKPRRASRSAALRRWAKSIGPAGPNRRRTRSRAMSVQSPSKASM